MCDFTFVTGIKNISERKKQQKSLKTCVHFFGLNSSCICAGYCGAEPEMSMSSAFMGVPGGGLGIFIDRDQLSIFLGFEF